MWYYLEASSGCRNLQTSVLVILEYACKTLTIRRYGTPGPDGTKIISAAWQSGINCGTLVSAHYVSLSSVRDP
jgi:hypothetical protein